MTLVSREKLFAEFDVKPAASPAAVARCQSDLKFPLPAEYMQFLEQMNGGEGFIGENYLRAWPVEDLIQNNKDLTSPPLNAQAEEGRRSPLIPARLPRRSSLSHLLLSAWKTRSQ